MRPPAKKRIDSETALPPTDPGSADSRTEALQEKAKLAQHLHAQGVNPVRWTAAHPAPQSDQATFQKTGLKPKDNQFEVGGKLYDWSPAVTATPQQAKAIADAYIAERTGKDDAIAPAPAIEDLVNVADVQLKHPFGTPHNKRPANDTSAADEHAALLRHYAQSGVDPDRAHLGDPVEMKEQERLKAQIEKVLPGDKSEISGLPVFYQGFDDGWIYQTNEHTRESEEVQRIRRERAPANGEPANNNDETVDKIVKHYNVRRPRPKARTAGDMFAEYSAAIGNLPAVAALIDDLKAGKPLTDRQKRMEAGIAASLRRAGIEFDYEAADPDRIRGIQVLEKRFQNSLDASDPDAIQSAMALFGHQVSEALAGGRFDVIRMRQAGSVWDRVNIALGLYPPAGRPNAAKGNLTSVNVEAAKDGPIDYDAAINEMNNLLTYIGVNNHESTAIGSESAEGLESARTGNALNPASPETIRSLEMGLTDASSVEIFIGGIPLFKQSEHKTLMDEIFRTEFIKVAQENGCLPGPEDEGNWSSHGGSKPQRRITDVDQAGHLGSRQSDSWVRWKNPDGSWTETLWNSTSTRADGFTEITREALALKDILVKADKQFAMNGNMEKLSRLTAEPVRGKANIAAMGEKPAWSEAELREYISKKVRDFFNRNFKNCRFVGENRIEKFDSPDDPDLPLTPPR